MPALPQWKHPTTGQLLEWRCQNRVCARVFAEYVNGCPCCATGESGGSHAVRLVAKRLASASKGRPS
jgi:hypothetical protein